MSYHNTSTSSTPSTTASSRLTAPPGYHYMPNGTLMRDEDHNFLIDSPDFGAGISISLFDMDLSAILAAGEVRRFSIAGTAGASFRLQIKNEDSYYYNFTTKLFQSEKSELTASISKSSYVGSVKFPTVTDNDQYDIFLFAQPGTEHATYSEVRFGDESIDINSSEGSNSLLIKKVIYQYVNLALTLTCFSSSGDITGTAVANAAINVGAGTGLDTAESFSMTFTVANDKALQVLRQPRQRDVVSYVIPVIGSDPLDIPGENIYPAITTAANSTSEGGTTVNGASTGTTVTTHVVSSTIATLGDRVLGNAALAATVVTVTAISGGSGKTFTISQAISIADDLPLTFSNRMNYRWPINNFAHTLKAGFYVNPSTNLSENPTLADYSDTTIALPGTPQEKTYINYEFDAVDTLGLKPILTNGEVTTQAGAIIFSAQQKLALAGDSLKIGGYGRNEILRTYGYDVYFSELQVVLTEVSTTTTAAVNNSTSVPVTSRNGILDDVSTVSGIGIAADVANPTVDTGAGAVSGAGTLVLTAAQTLEDGATLTFANAGLVATITGNIKIIKAGTAAQTLRFDIDKFLSIT